MKKINFKNILNNFKNSKSKRYYLLLSIVTLILLVGGTYAYFSINTSTAGNGASIVGSAKNLGNPTMKTVTSNLYLNVNASMMSEDNIGTEYLATTSPDELAFGFAFNLYNNYFKTVQAYCESVGDETCSEKQTEVENELYPDGISGSLTLSEIFSLSKLLQEKLSTVADVPNDVKTAREAVDNADKEISNHIYTLATVSLNDGSADLICTYNFKVTATVKNEIDDDSDQDINVYIGENLIGFFGSSSGDVKVAGSTDLRSSVSAGDDGIIISGKIKISPGEEKNIDILASILNSEDVQDKLKGNSYTLTIEPYINGDTKAFSCKLYKTLDGLAKSLVESGNLWESGLEGDGYRFTGSYNTLCSYDNGNFTYPADNQSTTPTCPTLYNYTVTRISDGYTWNYAYQTSCPSDNSVCTYSCTELTAESMVSPNVPNNFICFGTTDKDTCTANPSTYMYRIIGVFQDDNEGHHVKLIKYTQLGSYAWHSSVTDVDWADSDLYKDLNGSYFLTNLNYSYMQDSTWLNKITDWKWTAVNTLTYISSGPDYLRGLSPSNIYLHEMNRTGKTSTIGEWTTATAKIGLMYASDYALSLGATALAMTTGTYTGEATLKNGWMHQSNNDTSASIDEWTISREGPGPNRYEINPLAIHDDGTINSYGELATIAVRPVFYLTSDVKFTSGTGTLTDPYILE